VKNISKGNSSYRFSTRSQHNLSVGDHINMNVAKGNEIAVNNLKVLEIPDALTFVTEKPQLSLVSDKKERPGMSFEKLGVKCTLTFKIQ